MPQQRTTPADAGSDDKLRRRRELSTRSVFRSALELADALHAMTEEHGVWPDDDLFQTLGIANHLDGLQQDVQRYRKLHDKDKDES